MIKLPTINCQLLTAHCYCPLPLLTALAFFMLSVSCKDDNTLPPLEYGYEYFPLQAGTVVFYDVDSVVYDDFRQTVDTFSFSLRDSVTSSFTDDTKQDVYFVERYKKPSDTASWVYQQTMRVNRTPLTAEVVEGNQRYVRLVFPVAEGKYWNGNIYTNLGERRYRYTEVGRASTVNEKNFMQTLTVVQIDESNLIREDYAEEKYAINIGLIYKEVRELNKDIQTGKVTSGVIYIQKIK